MSEKSEQDAGTRFALERLRQELKPGDTVYCILRRVSASRMSRVISLLTFPVVDGKVLPNDLSYSAALGMDLKHDPDTWGVKVNGTGMDMGLHLVMSLSKELFGNPDALKHTWL